MTDSIGSGVSPACTRSEIDEGARSVVPVQSKDHVRLLEFEARHPGHYPLKEQAIRVELGVSPPRYYQLLLRVIDSPAAVKHDPVLVNRLIRVRDRKAKGLAARFAVA